MNLESLSLLKTSGLGETKKQPMEPPPPLRPSMRRKSSAQNLFSTFKTPQQPTPTGQPSTAQTAHHPHPPPTLPQTPTTANPMSSGREWDAQSLHSDSLPTPAATQSTSDEYLRDLIQKRILTLTYIRNIHEGCVERYYAVFICSVLPLFCRRSHWFHTILISRADLDREFNNNDMKKRFVRRIVLG